MSTQRKVLVHWTSACSARTRDGTLFALPWYMGFRIGGARAAALAAVLASFFVVGCDLSGEEPGATDFVAETARNAWGCTAYGSDLPFGAFPIELATGFGAPTQERALASCNGYLATRPQASRYNSEWCDCQAR